MLNRNLPKRVLFFLSDLDGGGAQRTMINLINAISDYDIDATLVVARAGGAAQNWVRGHVRLIDLKVGRTLHALPGLRQQLLSLKPDVLVATMVDANIMASIAAMGLRRRIRVILRETNSHRARGDIRGVRRTLIKWSYLHADTVVALSSGVRDELVADYGLDGNNVVTIGNPVDIESIAVAADEARVDLPPFSNDGEPVVIAVGRLTKQKGFDILIRAFAKLTVPAKLVILGEGPDRQQLLELAQTENVTERLIMPGFVVNPVAWLCHADVFVLSSRWEGFGHVIVEAMAAGVPVVATDCPYGPADIVVNGQNGVLVAQGNEDDMAAAIEDLLSNREKAASLKKSATDGIPRFGIKEILNKYLRVFFPV